nr:MAG TPA: hypothetical protein [Caudoviricetes sp.]
MSSPAWLARRARALQRPTTIKGEPLWIRW